MTLKKLLKEFDDQFLKYSNHLTAKGNKRLTNSQVEELKQFITKAYGEAQKDILGRVEEEVIDTFVVRIKDGEDYVLDFDASDIIKHHLRQKLEAIKKEL